MMRTLCSTKSQGAIWDDRRSPEGRAPGMARVNPSLDGVFPTRSTSHLPVLVSATNRKGALVAPFLFVRFSRIRTLDRFANPPQPYPC
jgi:hypothetical protein